MCSSSKTSTASVSAYSRPSDEQEAQKPLSEEDNAKLNRLSQSAVHLNNMAASILSTDMNIKAVLERVSQTDKNRAASMLNKSTSYSIAKMPSENLIYVSPSFTNTFGYSNEEVKGTNCRFLQGKDNNQVARKLMRDAINNKRGIVVMLRNYHKDGRLINNLVSLKPLFDKDGNNFAYLGCQLDITDKIKEIPDELQERIGKFEGRQRSEVLKAELSKLSKFFGETLDEVFAAVDRGGR